MSGAPTKLGRYVLLRPIGSGGMATIYLGRVAGDAGFSRIVAIKRLHPQLAEDPELATMFLDEARMAACVRHPNVASILDVVQTDGELFLVMDYVHGEPLSRLVRRVREGADGIPLDVASRITTDVLEALEAAHEAVGPRGEPLGLVHRDVSPQNVLVGADGVARLIDFGVAKAAGRLRTTRNGDIRGKLKYLAPEQVLGKGATRRTDIYAASVVLWELLAQRRLFQGEAPEEIFQEIVMGTIKPPSAYASVPPELDALVLRGLSHEPEERFGSAREMANALVACTPPCSAGVCAQWIERVAGDALRQRKTEVIQWEMAEQARSQMTETPSAPPEAPPPAVAATPAHTPKRPRMRASLVAGIALLLAISAIAFARARRGADGDATSAAGVTTAVPTPTPLPTTVSPDRDLPPSIVIETASPSSSPAPSLRGRAAPSAGKRRSSPSADCEFPYVVDGSGNRVYKRECL